MQARKAKKKTQTQTPTQTKFILVHILNINQKTTDIDKFIDHNKSLQLLCYMCAKAHVQRAKKKTAKNEKERKQHGANSHHKRKNFLHLFLRNPLPKTTQKHQNKHNNVFVGHAQNNKAHAKTVLQNSCSFLK